MITTSVLSITPSVCFLIDVPENITGSWYEGEVHVLFKDSAFEPSSPPRHSAEFFNLVEEKAVRNPIVFMYTDGGHVYQCQAYKT